MRGLAVIAGAGAVWSVVVGVPVPLPRARHLADPRTLVVGVLVGCVAWVVTMVAFEVAALASSIAVLAASVPLALARKEARAAEARIRQSWPDILLRVRSSLAAGVTIADATVGAFETAGEPFSAIAGDIRREVMFGGGFGTAARAAQDRFSDAISDRVLATLDAASIAGGHRVGEIVGALAVSVGDEVRLHATHEAAMTEQRMTVNVALVAPWALLVLAMATNPQARIAFEGRGGAVLIGAGLLATGVGWLLSMRAVHLSAIPRVFE